MPPLQRIVLIGVGLIGGSFVLDLQRQGLVREVVGVDVDADNLARALERGVIHQARTDVDARLLAGTDLVLLATPVSTLPALCAQLAPLLPAHTLVSDVGSTKQSALAAFKQHLPQQWPRCVAAHPIAGSDRHGALAAQFGLFKDRKLVLCPHPEQDTAALAQVEALWQAVGAQTHCMSAAEHDAVFAAVSHLPHLLAYAYMHQIATADTREQWLTFAGSGFRDFTRIAASSPALWADIALANQDDLLRLLHTQQQQLTLLQQLLQQGNKSELMRYFQEASQAREHWQEQNNS